MLTCITAHSGCEKTAPNSREHILSAVESGAEFLEIDVRRSADGLLYLSHDESLSPDGCVTFSELLELTAPSGIRINADLKAPGLLKPVFEEARAAGQETRVYFTGDAHSDADDVNDLVRRTADETLWERVWINADRGETDEERLADAFAYAEKNGCPVVNLYYGMVTPETLAAVRAMGKDFSAWTADSEEEIRRLLGLGVRNITTRLPKLAVRLRAEMQK